MNSVETWVSPSELESISKPRSVSASKEGRRLIILMISLFSFMCVVFGAGFALGWRRHHQFEVVQRDGITLTGKVSDKRYVGGKGAHYQVRYTYQVGSEAYENTAPINYRDYQLLALGSPVALRYLPSQPQVARLMTERDDRFYGIFLLFPLFNLFTVFLIIRQVSKQKNILSLGDPAAGIVESRKREKKGYTVYYRFQDQLGKEVHGKCTLSQNQAPDVGATLTILYLPNQSDQNVIYPTPLAVLTRSIYS